ncbi:MAG: LapA family protein [Thermodesulfobacteriota bacterium]|nr:LapA family protein [Thermodesulfobacteriota bacterium]
MKNLRRMVVLLVALLAVIITVQNYETMSTPVKFSVDLVFLDYETSEFPLAFVSIITFLVGVILIWLCFMLEHVRLKRQIKTLIRDAKERDKELNSLRNLPVTDEDISPDQIPDAK